MMKLIGIVALSCCLACTPEVRHYPAAESDGGKPGAVAALKDACCDVEDAGQALSDSSIYHLDSRWLNQAGNAVELSDLRGRVRVVAMIFTHCRYACPRLTADMLAIEAGLTDSERAQAGFVLFSIDPERDTPAALLAYAREYELDLAHWTLLRGEIPAVQDLAAVLGVKYKRSPSGDYSHSNLISVLDRNGNIVYQQEGLNTMPDEAVAVVRTLLDAS